MIEFVASWIGIILAFILIGLFSPHGGNPTFPTF